MIKMISNGMIRSSCSGSEISPKPTFSRQLQKKTAKLYLRRKRGDPESAEQEKKEFQALSWHTGNLY